MIVKYKNKVMYAIDKNGVHHVVDKYWQEYMLDRAKTPAKVIIYDTLKAMKAAYKAEEYK